MEVTCQLNIKKEIKKSFKEILSDFGIKQNVILNIKEEPFLKTNSNNIEITLTENTLKDEKIGIPQLLALLLKSPGEIKTPVQYISTQKEFFWDYVQPLERHVVIYRGIMPPWNNSTKQFLNLITDLKEEIKDKELLELGTGSGIQAILQARYGANVVATDIVPSAIENAKFNAELETKEVQQNITFGISDIYSNLNEIIGESNHLFDFLFFNNPVMLGDAKTGDLLSQNSYAGTDFQVIKEALTGLPKILKSSGKAYFLVMELKQKISSIWTNFHLEESLPAGFKCNHACTPFEFDTELGFASAIYCVYRAS